MKTMSLTNDLGLKKTRSPTKDQGLKKTTPRPETPLLVSRLKTGLVLLSQHLHLHLQVCLHPHAERELGRANKLPKKTKKQILRYVADEISAIPNLRHVFNFFLSGTCLWLIYPGLQTNHFPRHCRPKFWSTNTYIPSMYTTTC